MLAMLTPRWVSALHIVILTLRSRESLSVKVSGKLCSDGLVKKDCESDSTSLMQAHMNRDSRKKSTALRQSFFQVGDGKVKATDQTDTHWIFSNPVTLGVGLGLLLIGPDHLGTLMALSTLTTGFASFKVGFAWGVGHSIGMILIVPLFFLLKKLSTKTWNVSMDSWEYYGDYCIGASMILISFYFVLYEHHYIERKDDGTFNMKSCGCCDQIEAEATTTDRSDNENPNLREICSKYGAASPKKLASQSSGDASRSFSNLNGQSGSAWNTLWKPIFSGRDWQGAAVGILQGLCCPTGLMGIGFMGKIGTNSSFAVLMAFAVVFLITSGMGSGAITFGWGTLSSRGFASCCSPRMMYLSSCVATGLLGLIWVVANAAGVLHHINYAEKLHPHHAMENFEHFD
jgi:hypothetical protein